MEYNGYPHKLVYIWPTKPVKVLDICGFSAPLSRGVVGVTPWIPMDTRLCA